VSGPRYDCDVGDGGGVVVGGVVGGGVGGCCVVVPHLVAGDHRSSHYSDSGPAFSPAGT